jgi:hypothetical protein
MCRLIAAMKVTEAGNWLKPGCYKTSSPCWLYFFDVLIKCNESGSTGCLFIPFIGSGSLHFMDGYP